MKLVLKLTLETFKKLSFQKTLPDFFDSDFSDLINLFMVRNFFECNFIIIFDFFSDRRFLGLGFGGVVNGRVSHCFPLNGKSREPYCQGIDGVINAYYDSLENGKHLN